MIQRMGLKAQTKVLTLNGRNYRMTFDMAALAYAENVYEDYFHKPTNVSEIIADLVLGKQRAVMAIGYAAMQSAGENVTFEEFTKEVYNFENAAEYQQTVTDALLKMMKVGDGTGEDDGKKASSRGEH